MSVLDINQSPDKGIIDIIMDGVGGNPAPVVLDDASFKELIANLDLRNFATYLVRLGISSWGTTTALRVKSQVKPKTTLTYEDTLTPKATATIGQLTYTVDEHLFETANVGTPDAVNFVLQTGPARDSRIVAQDLGAGSLTVNRVTLVPGKAF